MLYKFNQKYFREIINGQGAIRRDTVVNVITLKILMLHKSY